MNNSNGYSSCKVLLKYFILERTRNRVSGTNLWAMAGSAAEIRVIWRLASSGCYPKSHAMCLSACPGVGGDSPFRKVAQFPENNRTSLRLRRVFLAEIASQMGASSAEMWIIAVWRTNWAKNSEFERKSPNPSQKYQIRACSCV